MKKINLTNEKLNKIKQIHLDYCKKHVRYKKLGLSDMDAIKVYKIVKSSDLIKRFKTLEQNQIQDDL